MRHFLAALGLLAVLLASCSLQPTPVNTPEAISPRMTPASVHPSFIIFAYAADGIIPEIIPYEQLTHIHYSFLTPNADGTFNPMANGWKLKQIVGTANQHDVPVRLSGGGWGWNAHFEELAADPEARTAFVQNLTAFVDKYQLDGTDIDWEFLNAGQSSQNFLARRSEVRAAMPDALRKTAVVFFGADNGGAVPSETFELCDFVNIMTYDGPGHGSMEHFVSYGRAHSPPQEKIVMGVPFYSHVKDWQAKSVTYARLVKDNPGAAQVDEFDYSGLIQIYNGIPTVQAKTNIAMQQANGIMFWALDHDTQVELSLVSASDSACLILSFSRRGTPYLRSAQVPLRDSVRERHLHDLPGKSPARAVTWPSRQLQRRGCARTCSSRACPKPTICTC